MKKEVTKTLHIQMQCKEEFITKMVISGNPTPLIAKMYQEFIEHVKYYEDDGYTIKDKNIEKLSFTAEKMVLVEED